MKKLYALLLSAAMVLSLTACGGGEAPKTPEQLYTEAVEKTAALENYQADVVIDMNMDLGGMSMGIVMDMDMKIKGTGTNVQMAMDASTEIMGEALNMKYYYKDGVLYLNAMGQTGKMTLPVEEAMAQAGADMNTSTDLELMENFEMVENEDGTRTFTFTIKQEAMQQAIADAMAADAVNEMFTEEDMKFNSMGGEVTVGKDGYISNQKMNMDFTMNIEGQDVAVVMTMDMAFVEPGADFEIEFPADLDTYPEMDLTAAA